MRKDGTRFWADMATTALRASDGELRGFGKLVRDLTQRKRAEDNLRESEAALRVARDQALETSQLKSAFLANMSHEIRTPMNGVLGMAQVLAEAETNAVKRDRMLVLRDSARELLAILDGILDFSKVEAGRIELEEIDFDLRGGIESVVSLLNLSAQQKGLDLEIDLSPEVPRWVRGDPARLRQVLVNLVGNAVKFTDTGGVTVRVANGRAGHVRFEVADTGIGIDRHARKRLFEPFSQADSSTTRRFGGTGLGLAISRQLVTLMGGDLDLESQPGEGTTFSFEVPLPEAVPPAAAPPDRERRPPAPASPASPASPTALVPMISAARREAADSESGRVLLVEDSAVNRLVATTMLERLGYQVDAAADGAQAVEAVRATPYDVVLMDCLMPVMDGYEATTRIRRLEGPERATPIVAVTASAMTGDRERCLASGMDDYVSKPLDLEALAAALRRCTASVGSVAPS